MTMQHLDGSSVFQPSEPLWQRVPTRDTDGKALSDFMMLIPRLKHWPAVRQQRVFQDLRRLFTELEEQVAFADLNLRLNLLWISLYAESGGCQRVSGLVRERVPEAVLIASQAEVLAGMFENAGQRRGWRARIRGLLPG